MAAAVDTAVLFHAPSLAKPNYEFRKPWNPWFSNSAWIFWTLLLLVVIQIPSFITSLLSRHKEGISPKHKNVLVSRLKNEISKITVYTAAEVKNCRMTTLKQQQIN